MAAKRIIILLSSLLCWSHGSPNPGWRRLPSSKMATLNNRAEGGFFFFPSLQSLNSFLGNGISFRGVQDNLFRSTNTLDFTDGNTEKTLTSPDYDGSTIYRTELDQETTIFAGDNKHVLLKFDAFDIEDPIRGDRCVYDYVEVLRTKNQISDESTSLSTGESEYCGSDNGPRTPQDLILSSGNEMVVSFHSDGYNEGDTGFTATVWEVSKVVEDSKFEDYETWGPEFKISFDLLIFNEATELQSIFAFLGDHFTNLPLILLDGNKLRFTTSYPLAGKTHVSHEVEVEMKKWLKIVVETRRSADDDKFDFVITVDGVEETFEDVAAKEIKDVTLWITHLELNAADAVYKNLQITPAANQPGSAPANPLGSG